MSSVYYFIRIAHNSILWLFIKAIQLWNKFTDTAWYPMIVSLFPLSFYLIGGMRDWDINTDNWHMGWKVTSILRDKSITLHESPDENLSVQEGKTGKIWRQELRGNPEGVDFITIQGAWEIRAQVRLGKKIGVGWWKLFHVKLRNVDFRANATVGSGEGGWTQHTEQKWVMSWIRALEREGRAVRQDISWKEKR